MMPKTFRSGCDLAWMLLVFLGLAAAAACWPDTPPGCDVNSKLGACVTLLNVRPHYGEVDTSNVDAFRGQCEVRVGGIIELEPEPFADHGVILEVFNRAAPHKQQDPWFSPSITLQSYSITFRANECVAASGLPGECPALAPMELPGPTVTIPGDVQQEIHLPLIPLRKKIEYQTKGGDAVAIPSYVADVEISGRDAEGRFKLNGSVEFSIGDFDYCPEN